ncbi:hypothetical protein H1S01_20130, partial [Heliobacterium chlorum]
MKSSLEIKGEWFFEEGGRVIGPLFNFITSAGLEHLSQSIADLPSPYLVVGDDTNPGETIVEVFRKPVSSIIVSRNQVRFRTQFLSGEANGD